jgi:hypothetical protein
MKPVNMIGKNCMITFACSGSDGGGLSFLLDEHG